MSGDPRGAGRDRCRFARQSGPDVLLRIKVVPGASRDQVAGALGDRLKVRVSAAPEAGRANRAVCALLARALDLSGKRVAVDSGPASPEKTVRIRDASVDAVRARLAGE